MGPQDVKVELHDGVLQISGSRKPRHEPKDARGHILLRRERSSFTFSRAFSLPENANPDGITAAMDKGVLVVTVPKRPQDTARPPAPKRIAVAAKL
ncbi:hypothetical protein HXX76_003898 [Chlamydomonas incerta]|uniref:SHSP domain-containing protein n=1 Tax=Chlamydomonas incerta TaxID=51695 RepID=A0A835TLI2_CHLIN|nr:hypothetical protein HXX76_003898 [Chlamydomonas incerta]|eukprot:KAG2441045.1 hypothetical protein HXX76_003898 [Chlamydomonas incerta]